MEDSWNLTCSPTTKELALRLTISTVVALRLTTWPIARLSWPTTFSPIIASVFRFNPLINFSLSNVGVAVVFDSYTATILTTSGTLSDISSSSTLKP